MDVDRKRRLRCRFRFRGQTIGVLEGVQIHRDVQRYTAQRGRAVSGRAETNSVTGDEGQEETEPTKEAHARVEDIAVVAHCQGNTAKDVFARLQVQVMRQFARTLKRRHT